MPIRSTSQGLSGVGVTPDLQKDQEELVKRAVEVLERQFIPYVSKTKIADHHSLYDRSFSHWSQKRCLSMAVASLHMQSSKLIVVSA